MNQGHIDYLSSPEWAKQLQGDLLPWLESAGHLGDDVLEIGPGPGLSTDLLRARAAHVTAIEIDPALAEPLRVRLAGTNVDVFEGDAASSGFESNRFSSETCFAVLHHMPSSDHQDRVFAELGRVLAPGAPFFCTDTLDTERARNGHRDDVFTPVDPKTVEPRLNRAGLSLIRIDQDDREFRLVAIKDRPSGLTLPSR